MYEFYSKNEIRKLISEKHIDIEILTMYCKDEVAKVRKKYKKKIKKLEDDIQYLASIYDEIIMKEKKYKIILDIFNEYSI